MAEYSYKNPAGNRFPVIAKAPIPQKFADLFSSDPKVRKDQAGQYSESFKDIANSMKACGFNVTLLGSAFELMDALADACESAGINVILNPAWLNDDTDHTKAVLDYYKNKSQPVAWEVFDQPKFYDWGNAYAGSADSVTVWNNLTVALRMARELDSNRMSYFNLAAPEIDSSHPVPEEWLGSCKDYNEYLDVLGRLYKPALWSYDLYPFIMKGDSTDIEVRYDHFYKYLKIFSDRALATGAPFWAYAMCQGHTRWEVDSAGRRTKAWTQPVPTVGMLRFEAFNALAFGAQGLVYWQYGQPSDSPSTESGLTFGPAPFDFTVNGTGSDKTLTPVTNPVWYEVQTVNKEIQKYADVFLGCQIDHIWHHGKTYDGQPMFPGSYGHIAKLMCEKEGVLISAFKKGGKNYFVIVNQDPFADHDVQISISSDTQGAFLSDEPPARFSIPKPAKPYMGLAQTFIKTLPAGGAVILEWTEYNPTAEIIPMP